MKRFETRQWNLTDMGQDYQIKKLRKEVQDVLARMEELEQKIENIKNPTAPMPSDPGVSDDYEGDLPTQFISDILFHYQFQEPTSIDMTKNWNATVDRLDYCFEHRGCLVLRLPKGMTPKMSCGYSPFMQNTSDSYDYFITQVQSIGTTITVTLLLNDIDVSSAPELLPI